MIETGSRATKSAAAALGIFCLSALLCPSGAHAQSPPSQGDFRITFTGTYPSVMKPLMMGQNRMVSTGTALMSAVNQAGSGLLHNMAGRCTSMNFVDSGAKTVEQHGFCDYIDSAGDHVFERFDFPVQPLAATIHATGEWIGGTGKFAGLGGKFDIQATRLNPTVEGVAQVAGQKVGHYTIEKTTVAK